MKQNGDAHDGQAKIRLTPKKPSDWDIGSDDQWHGHKLLTWRRLQRILISGRPEPSDQPAQAQPVGVAPSPAAQRPLDNPENKMVLEQAMDCLVGERTGLIMLLDIMLHAAEQGNPKSFQFYARAYAHQYPKLEKLLRRYADLMKEVPPGDRPDGVLLSLKANPSTAALRAAATPKLPLYQLLVQIGHALPLLQTTEPVAPELLTRWREETLPRIQPYLKGTFPMTEEDS